MDVPVPIFQQVLGPLGLELAPAGDHVFEELVEAYDAQLTAETGPIHICAMTSMAECRAAMLAAGERGLGPLWVSWSCDEEGTSPAGVKIPAALIVAGGMGAAAFGLNCPRPVAEPLLAELARYAQFPLFSVWEGQVETYAYEPIPQDPDAIPCATGAGPCFVTRTVDVGEELKCGPDLLENIIAAEDAPVGAVKIAILGPDDVDVFAQQQYAVRDALCLWSDVPELLEAALRVYQGRAFYDGTGELERPVLDRLSQKYGLNVL